MSLSGYELSLVLEARKGKKKAIERLYDAYHKRLGDVVEAEIGSRNNADVILQAVFQKAAAQIQSMNDPFQFESYIIQATQAECRSNPAAYGQSGNEGSSQFASYNNAANRNSARPNGNAQQPQRPAQAPNNYRR